MEPLAAGAKPTVERRPDRPPGFLARLIGFVRLVHPFPVAVVVGTSVLLVLIVRPHGLSAAYLARAGAVVLLSQIAVGALNDWKDRRHDALVQPDKPIPAGLVTPAAAMVLTLLSLAGFLPLALTFGWVAFLLAVVGTGGGLAYDLWLKPTAWSVLGYLVGFLALISWAWVVAGRFTPIYLLTYPGGACLLTAAHLAQSLPDIETDRQTGQRGIATILGPFRSFCAIVLLFGLIDGAAVLLALLSHSTPALALAILSLAGPALALRSWFASKGSRRARLGVFRFMAPAIGALGLACLLALVAWH